MVAYSLRQCIHRADTSDPRILTDINCLVSMQVSLHLFPDSFPVRSEPEVHQEITKQLNSCSHETLKVVI